MSHLDPNRLRLHRGLLRSDEPHPAVRPIHRRSFVREAQPVGTDAAIVKPRRYFREPGGEAESTLERSQVARRFRSQFAVLRSIAKDPVVYDVEEGAVLRDLRETLSIAESALRHLNELDPATNDRSILKNIELLASAIERRADDLFLRMERVNRLRQRMYKLSAILENLPFGRLPRAADIKTLAYEIDIDLEKIDRLVFLLPQDPDTCLQVAANSLNMAYLGGWISVREPEWFQESEMVIATGLLSDTGLIEVGKDSLLPGNDGPEQCLIRRHPLYSAAVVERIDGLDDRIANAVRQHHERLDGTGFPERIRGAEIDSIARLMAVIDEYIELCKPASQLSYEDVLDKLVGRAELGKLDKAWVSRLPDEPPQWVRIVGAPEPPAVSKSETCAA